MGYLLISYGTSFCPNITATRRGIAQEVVIIELNTDSNAVFTTLILDVEYLVTLEADFIKLAEFRQPDRGGGSNGQLIIDVWSEYAAHYKEFV
ncbi:hypothetical protein AVEN_220732-1 [Araneus ventricosus]|uniref:Uncharacterized protein n=1 Tax=Araneus ventricosus TaxID=182803 RepID=A0A4Y2PY34_ARAVE|nr:hypothetical protein AVEN_220732-1 [Araneus ventricosus]